MSFQVNNKNIDNASGQQVREDIEKTIKCLATNNFGQRQSGGTLLPCEFFADDTDNKLKIRATTGGDQADPNDSNAATLFTIGDLDADNLNLLPKAGGSMTGPIRGDDAVGAATPAFSFDGDNDTGIYRPTTNQIGFSTGGLERAIIASTGVTIADQKELRLNELASNGFSFIGLKAPASITGNRSFTLPETTGSPGQFLSVKSTNHSTTNAELEFSSVAGVPVGSVFCMAGNHLPSGYLKCNGASLARAGTYAALFNVIGTTYGAADSNHFYIPDLRGEFVRGWIDDRPGFEANRGIGSFQDQDNRFHAHAASSSVSDSGHFHFSFRNARAGYDRNHHNLTTANYPAAEIGPSANEGYNIRSTNDGGASNVGRTSTAGTGISVTTGIGGDGSESRPRNRALLYIIKF
jgi:microcystin-dependent protein